MSGETELKPCPNPDCDKSKGLLSRNTVIRGGRIPEYVVSCLTCGMSGPACSGPYQAMEGWNGLPRANPPGYELVPEGTDDYRALYHELIYQVGIKHPDETRHQTALRYLKNAENHQNNAAQQTQKETPNAPKAYEVSRCMDCPTSRIDGHYCYCRDNIDKGMISSSDPIPAWCPLPELLATKRKVDKET